MQKKEDMNKNQQGVILYLKSKLSRQQIRHQDLKKILGDEREKRKILEHKIEFLEDQINRNKKNSVIKF